MYSDRYQADVDAVPKEQREGLGDMPSSGRVALALDSADPGFSRVCVRTALSLQHVWAVGASKAYCPETQAVTLLRVEDPPPRCQGLAVEFKENAYPVHRDVSPIADTIYG